MHIIEKSLGYQFRNQKLLTEALTHKSFCVGEHKNKPHNERLEFLGDAILGLVMAEYLMQTFPEDAEGLLSKKRASLVNQEILCVKATSLEMQSHIILGPGEKEQNSHLKPRVLASTFEALIGALYTDSNYEIVRAWVISQFSQDIKEIKPHLEYEKDYKTRLQELTQKMKLGTPTYRLISMKGPSHDPEFLVSIEVDHQEKARAVGKTKKMAEQVAAQILLSELTVAETKSAKVK